MKSKLIAVTIGDIDGIGIDLLIKIWKKKIIRNNFFIISNYKILKKYIDSKYKKIKIHICNSSLTKIKIKEEFLNVYDINSLKKTENTYGSLLQSHKIVKLPNILGIINLPLNKKKIINEIDSNFIGQTEFYQKLDRKKNSNMFFYSEKLIVSTLTTHIPLSKVSKFISNKNKLLDKIYEIYKSLTNTFNIKNPKILLLGLNPHAGESGIFGNEEIAILKPTIKILKNKYNINIDGPTSADSAFSKKNIRYYDCIVGMYHDQALIPFKILYEYIGVNITGSLSFTRVSPVHGTGYDIKKLKKGNHNSLLNCFKLINKINKIN